MKAVTLHVQGKLLQEIDAASGRSVLLLTDPAPAEKGADSLYLRFPLVTRGKEAHIFPALLLDDWGKEIRGRALYEWIADYGQQFPRAEVFGFNKDGSETQVFLRALELFAKLPCYVYQNRRQPMAEGATAAGILVTDETAVAPRRIKRPDGLERPLRRARVSWWQVPPGRETFDFSLLDAPVDPGY